MSDILWVRPLGTGGLAVTQQEVAESIAAAIDGSDFLDNGGLHTEQWNRGGCIYFTVMPWFYNGGDTEY